MIYSGCVIAVSMLSANLTKLCSLRDLKNIIPLKIFVLDSRKKSFFRESGRVEKK
jgi:hypothetical protein